MKALRFLIPGIMLLSLLILTASPAAAADEIKKAERRTPVIVEFEGGDAIGSELFSRLKSAIDSANPAEPARETKFRILLSTASEFPSRPGVGSVYAVVWTLAISDSRHRYRHAGHDGRRGQAHRRPYRRRLCPLRLPRPR